jgi:hypothetical protein
MRGTKCFYVKTPLLESARHERLQQNVKPWQEFQEQSAPLFRLKVQRDESLIAGINLPPKWHAPRGPLTKGIAFAGLLDFDNVRAEIGEQHPGEAAGDHARQVEDADAFKRSQEAIIPRLASAFA